MEGKVILISGFPGVGKSTVAQIYSDKENCKVYDLDSGIFKGNLVNREGMDPAVVANNWVSIYVDRIKKIINSARDAAKEGCNTIIMVSSHNVVRQQLNTLAGELDMMFYYAIPSKAMLNNTIIPDCKDRYDRLVEEGTAVEIDAALRAYEALRDHGEEFIDAAWKEKMDHQLVVELAEESGDPTYLIKCVETVLNGGAPNEDWEASVYDKPYETVTGYPQLSDDATEKLDILLSSISDNTVFEFCLDDQCHMILRSTTPVFEFTSKESVATLAKILEVDPEQTLYSAFAGSEFITLDKHDAQAIRELMDEIVTKNGGDDVEVFGDRGISYERLHDRLQGLVYPISKAIHDTDEPGDGLIRPEMAALEEGYYKFNDDNEPLILEHPSLDTDGTWTQEEWNTICKMLGLPAWKTTRIVMNVRDLECFIDENPEEDDDEE